MAQIGFRKILLNLLKVSGWRIESLCCYKDLGLGLTDLPILTGEGIALQRTPILTRTCFVQRGLARTERVPTSRRLYN